MPRTSSSTREISRTSSNAFVESGSSQDYVHQPAGLFPTNVSVVTGEQNVATTVRGKRFGGLSDVSFNVELVSSSSESSCLYLPATPTDVGTSALISPTTQQSANGCRDAESLHTEKLPSTRLMQSAPDIAPTVEPCEDLVSCSQSTRQIGCVQDKIKVLGRRSLGNCLESDRNGLGDAGLFKETYFNAFQTCNPKLRKGSKTPRNICSFKKHRRSVLPELEKCSPSACSKPHAPDRATTNRLSPPRRNSKDTTSQAERSNQEHVILSRSRMTKGENSDNKNSELENKGWTLDRTSTGPRTEESWMKRLVSRLIKCTSSDGKTDECCEEIWNSKQHN